MKLPQPLADAARLVRATFGRLAADDGWALASHLTLTALMAIFPFLIFVAALAGFFGQTDLANRVAQYLFDVWPAAVAEPIAREVHNVLTQPRGQVLTLSIALTLFLASNGVEAMRLVLDRAYRTRKSRSFALARLQSILFVIVGAAAALALAVLGILGPILWALVERQLPWLADLRGEFTLVRVSLTGGLVLVALVSAHLFLPGQRPRLLHILPGILATVVLGTVATWGFSYYLANYADYRSTYAGLASIVTALVYFHLLSLALVIGAELNGVLLDRWRRSNDPAAP